MARMGRPKADIDKQTFEKLCGIQCTKTELCDWFGVTDKTLDAFARREYHMTFSDVYEQKRATGKISLRRSQFQLAQKNATMAIWLGKQYLGQRDAVDVSIGKSDGDALKELERLVLDDESGGD